MNRNKIFLAVTTVALIALVSVNSKAAQQPFFLSMKSAAAHSDPGYRAIAGNRSTTSVQLVQADATQVSAKNATLTLGGFGVAYMKYSYQNPDGTTVWYGTFGKRFGALEAIREKMTGEIADDPINSVMIVRNGNKLAGTIRLNGETYSLQSLQSGGHVIAGVDQSKLPPEAHDDQPNGMGASLADNPKVKVALATATAAAPATVRVMIVYSGAAATEVGDTRAMSNLAIADSNQSFINSNVNMRFELAGSLVAYNYVNNTDLGVDRSRFVKKDDGYLDNFHPKRDEISADIGVLMTTSGSNCGVAGQNVSEAGAFAVVYHRCVAGFSFAHEIGHLIGATHDKASSTNPNYAYGHGYFNGTARWRTIMAYDTAANCPTGCPRINYWSNPNKTYNGKIMGNATTANNARVLNDRATTVAAFR